MIKRLISLPLTKSFFLFGPRQSGKSTLIHERFRDSIWSVDLLLTENLLAYSKDPSLFRAQAVEKITREKVKTIFIDEIQRVPALLNEIQSLLSSHKVQFIMTGSSARKLKRGGANLLAGRAVERHLFPFTYEEIKDDFNLESVLRFGTLPPLYGESENQKIDILTSYTHTYLIEEIQNEGISRNLGGFTRFLEVAAAQSGELLSFSAISRECQLPNKTVQSYYDVLEDTLIGFRLGPWGKSLRRRLTAHPKFYLFDLGVTNAINRRLTAPVDPVLRGRLFEHFIILELVRILSYQQSEAQLFYWRTNHGAEVDLLVEKHGKLAAAIEIKSTRHVGGNDLSGLRSFADDNRGVPRFLVAPVSEAYEMEKIRITPWQEFLSRIIHQIIQPAREK